MAGTATDLMKIGEVAKSTGIGVETIRFYERERLLQPPRRTPSGYRMYDAACLQRLRFIRRAKALGFSLEDIRTLLSIREGQEGDECGEVNRTAREKVAEVDAKIADLQRIRAGLMSLIDVCPGRGPLTECPIMSALDGEATAPPTTP